MNPQLRLLLAGALLAPAALAAASFEGKVTFNMSAPGRPPQEVHYAIKEGKFRIDMPGPEHAGAMIVDPTKKEMTMVMDQQRMYMTMPMSEAAPKAEPSTQDRPGESLEKTGETEKILGYTAEKYVAKFDGSTSDLWLAEGLGSFVPFNARGPMGGRRGGRGAQAQEWEKALAGKDLFPLRVISHDRDGKETFRLEATAIDKQPLPDSLFAPPPDYRHFDMGGMMRGMMPGGRGR